uniref:Uncharacterized protein n=1 Tax=Anopheles atroparvus TaxID=41427 RepID=A0AAG5DTP6_ANOAO
CIESKVPIQVVHKSIPFADDTNGVTKGLYEKAALVHCARQGAVRDVARPAADEPANNQDQDA